MFFKKCRLPSNYGSPTGFCCFLMGLIISLQIVNSLLNCSVVLHQFCSSYFNISNQDQNWVAKRTEMSELYKMSHAKKSGGFAKSSLAVHKITLKIELLFTYHYYFILFMNGQCAGQCTATAYTT